MTKKFLWAFIPLLLIPSVCLSDYLVAPPECKTIVSVSMSDSNLVVKCKDSSGNFRYYPSTTFYSQLEAPFFTRVATDSYLKTTVEWVKE
ncbi:MAG: hypothetical protein KKA70_10705 [Proteobacteria bacterium]|nr:hypothetical protein [Pseudomonadota bacterium]